MARVLMMIGLLALAACLACAQPADTETPKTFVDRSNGVETSIPGTTLPQGSQPAQPVPSVLYNRGGNTVLQNEAGSIYTRPDGRKVLVGVNGQTIVTRGDESDEDTSIDDDNDGFLTGFGGNNVVVNGRNGGHSFFSGNRETFVFNKAGEGGYQTYNNYQLRIVNGGLQLTVAGQVYNFPAKEASVKSTEQIEINGQKATVQYENGNIVVELADGTVLAKADGGLFSGNRQSYDNRKQIQEDVARETQKLEEELSQMHKNFQIQLSKQMKQLEEEIQSTLGNIRF